MEELQNLYNSISIQEGHFNTLLAESKRCGTANPAVNQQLGTHRDALSNLRNDFQQKIMDTVQSLEAEFGHLEQKSVQLRESSEAWTEQMRMAALRLDGPPQHYRAIVEKSRAIWSQGTDLLRRLHQIHRLQSGINSFNSLERRIRIFLLSTLQLAFLVETGPPLLTKPANIPLAVLLPNLGPETENLEVTVRVVPEKVGTALAAKGLNLHSLPADENKINGTSHETIRFQKDSSNMYMRAKLPKTKLKAENRKNGGKDTKAILNKLQIVFSIRIRIPAYAIDDELHAVSLPFVFSVHPVQDQKLWAGVLWDTMIGVGVRSAEWPRVAQMLLGAFSLISDVRMRQLSDSDLVYLRFRLFPHRPPPQGAPDMISADNLFKDPLHEIDQAEEYRNKLDFTFWEWFYNIADLLSKSQKDPKVRALWEDRFVFGFLCKSQATAILIKHHHNMVMHGLRPIPAFVIRFSDNLKGAVTVSLNCGDVVDHKDPFLKEKELSEKTLPKLIKELWELEDIHHVLCPNPQTSQLPTLRDKAALLDVDKTEARPSSVAMHNRRLGYSGFTQINKSNPQSVSLKRMSSPAMSEDTMSVASPPAYDSINSPYDYSNVASPASAYSHGYYPPNYSNQ